MVEEEGGIAGAFRGGREEWPEAHPGERKGGRKGRRKGRMVVGRKGKKKERREVGKKGGGGGYKNKSGITWRG